MTQPVPLTTGLGEVMAPQTLVTALIVSPDGSVKLDPGVLHGRSEMESRLEMAPQKSLVGEGQSIWVVWVAIELDQANAPLRYKGMAVSELWVNLQQRLGYKSMAEQVNRMSEAMRGGVNVARLTPQNRTAVKQKLLSVGAEVWERSAGEIKDALA